MKGPSLDAIRKFKEQQELKKRQEDERKAQEKLSTLEHRAAQGDRKAKQELKRIEQLKEERNKAIELQNNLNNAKNSKDQYNGNARKFNSGDAKTVTFDLKSTKPKRVETDFDELMRLAKQNTNEIKKVEEPQKCVPGSRLKKKKEVDDSVDCSLFQLNIRPTVIKKPGIKQAMPNVRQHDVKSNSIQKVESHQRNAVGKGTFMMQCSGAQPSLSSTSKPSSSQIRKPVQMPQRHFEPYQNRYHHLDDGEDEEDDYEEDDFVVDDDEEDVQDELRTTIRSVFKYDKRRCDLREEELDRQYRAIGRVSTFEDLEREERRASRLAAMEDARAQREEEERKRLKKIRLKKS